MIDRATRFIAKQEFSPEEQAVFERALREYREVLGPLEDDMEAWLANRTDDDLRSLEGIRSDLERRLTRHEGRFSSLFSDVARDGAQAGRATASRQFGLTIGTDVVPARTLEELDAWAADAAESTLETITEDSTLWLRGAHEDGLGIDDIADNLNDELFESRLEDHVSERAARTATTSSSNAGHHSAHEDAEGVVAERWVSAGDGRVRDSHSDAAGQVVAPDTRFEVGGAYLRYPADLQAPPSEIVNCRCTVVPVFADELNDTQLEEIQSGGRNWI